MNFSPHPFFDSPAPPPLTCTLPGCPSRSAPLALLVWELAGAFVVLRGCMGIRRSGVAKWTLCLFAAGDCLNILFMKWHTAKSAKSAKMV